MEGFFKRFMSTPSKRGKASCFSARAVANTSRMLQGRAQGVQQGDNTRN
jgi:hypothetical protein